MAAQSDLGGAVSVLETSPFAALALAFAFGRVAALDFELALWVDDDDAVPPVPPELELLSRYDVLGMFSSSSFKSSSEFLDCSPRL